VQQGADKAANRGATPLATADSVGHVAGAAYLREQGAISVASIRSQGTGWSVSTTVLLFSATVLSALTVLSGSVLLYCSVLLYYLSCCRRVQPRVPGVREPPLVASIHSTADVSHGNGVWGLLFVPKPRESAWQRECGGLSYFEGSSVRSRGVQVNSCKRALRSTRAKQGGAPIVRDPGPRPVALPLLLHPLAATPLRTPLCPFTLTLISSPPESVSKTLTA
jgi:hypothetical protein